MALSQESEIQIQGATIRQLAAIMFTDMIGYTALMQENEARARQLRERHRNVLQERITGHGGNILQYYGDGALSIFPSAIDAVTCAWRIQQDLRQDPAVPLRIGIHSGDVVRDSEGIYGDGVNVASRIESMSVSGSVLVSGKVYDEIKNQPDLPGKSMGWFDLKNVKTPVEVYALCCPDLVIPEPAALGREKQNPVSTIAVLPFSNFSNDPENEYFSDGITEELINSLTRVEGLRVISRTSSFLFKGKNMDVRQIGKDLNVSRILEGSVRKAGNRVRITAQLINTADGYHIWSENFDRQLEDIFAIQDEISAIIANKLRENLSASRPVHQTAPTENIEAYNLYLKGMFYWHKYNPADAKKAITLLEEAIQLEPGFILPYSAIAVNYSFLGATGQLKPMIAFPHAKKYAQKALELDASRGEPYTALALCALFYDWNWTEGERLLAKARSLSPGNVGNYIAGCFLNMALGKKHENVRIMEEAVKIDPLSILLNYFLGEVYFIDRQLEKAWIQYEKMEELEPSNRTAIEGKAGVLLEQGKIEEAIEMSREVYRRTGHPLKGLTPLAFALGVAGRIDEANECIQKIEERARIDSDAAMDGDLGWAYLGMKNYDKAYDHYKKAIDNKLWSIIYTYNYYPELVKAMPGYKELLALMNLNV